MAKQVDLLQGTLDMLILKAVSLGRLHGYGVLLRISKSQASSSSFSKARCTRRCTAWNTVKRSSMSGVKATIIDGQSITPSPTPGGAGCKARPRSGAAWRS